MPARPVALRWTIGDVSDFGFEALRLSLWGAWRIFGDQALYTVCVNTVPLEEAQARCGPAPEGVQWLSIPRDLPPFLERFLDAGMAEGVAWKFIPLRLFPEHYEITLDNDCILWEMPEGMRRWLAQDDPDACLIAADVAPCFGQFAPFCGVEPRNSGIRGLPPGFDFAKALQDMLERHPVTLKSELDEQGLQVATVSARAAPDVVSVEDVAITSPFPPHLPDLGRGGAHFVGLNVKSAPWEVEGRNAVELIREHWQRHRPALYERVGLEPA